MKNYTCSICGKTHVKLWRPHINSSLLACADCLEARQFPLRYKECIEVQKDGTCVLVPTGNILALPEMGILNFLLNFFNIQKTSCQKLSIMVLFF